LRHVRVLTVTVTTPFFDTDRVVVTDLDVLTVPAVVFVATLWVTFRELPPRTNVHVRVLSVVVTLPLVTLCEVEWHVDVAALADEIPNALSAIAMPATAVSFRMSVPFVCWSELTRRVTPRRG
jgi:hypothetical protein